MTDHHTNTTRPISKKQLLAEMQSEQAAWQALLNEIGEVNMTQPEVAGGWSIKDIVAHLTGWRRRTVQCLQAALPREEVAPPPWPLALQEDDEINAWMYQANRDRSLVAILNDEREVFQQLVDIIAAFPEHDLQDSQRFAWLEGEPLSAALCFGHFHEEHEPDMRVWLQRVRGS